MARIQFRRDTSANWTLYNPVLADGELGVDKTLNAMKVGDGTKTWSQLTFISADSLGVLDTSQFEGGSGLLDSTTDTVQKAFNAITIGLDIADENYDGIMSTYDKNKLRILSQINGIKDYVRVATTGNISLLGIQTINGALLAVGDRILVKNQTNKSENGIYVVANSAWARSSDTDSSAELSAGIITSVTDGAQAGSSWIFLNDGVAIVGTTPIEFSVYDNYSATSDYVDGGSW